MDWLTQLLDLFLHLDVHLDRAISEYGAWTYGILFAIIFAETGLVVTPFLPGDSLLFAAGALAGREGGTLHSGWLFVLLTIAAIIGDNLNYWIGRLMGSRIRFRDDARFLRKQYLDRTHAFFEAYGVKAIILARFVPIVRTFMPFVAGVGRMDYRVFLPFDILGGVVWVGVCVFAGRLFGQIPIVRDNFTLVALAVVFLSILPAIIGYIRHRRAARAFPVQVTEKPAEN